MRHTLSTIAFMGASLLPLPALALLPGLDTSVTCDAGQGRDVALCSIDTMKQWQRDHYNYHEDENKKHKEWHLENDPKGVTPENLKAHRDFHEHAKRVHNVSHDRQKTKEKQFGAQQARKRASVQNPHRPSRSSAQKSRFDEGKLACAKFKAEQSYRSCIKPYLRPAGR